MSREYCPDCTRPVSECYCDALVNINNSIKVTILQHPKEAEHPYNTGRIVARCLQDCNLVQGETLSKTVLASFMTPDTWLLFPNLSWLAQPVTNTKPPKHLVVIDASWNKAKKILHLNPALQQLPRLSLQNVKPSEYQVRKTSMADGLSTIESISAALSSLESAEQYKQLLQPFKRMVSLAQRYHPD